MGQYFARKPAKQRQMDFEVKLLQLITGCDLPVSLLERKEFTSLMQFLDPSVTVPSIKTFNGIILPRACSDIESELRILCDTCLSCSFTTDIWSQHRIGFLTVTSLFITSDYQFVTRNLGLQEFSAVDHSGVAISSALDAFISKYFQNNRKAIASITHDSASNMKAATGTLPFEQLLCINHALHNTVVDAFQEDYLGALVKSATGLVTFFRSSSKATAELHIQQKSKPSLNVTAPTNTRWNSVYNMLARLHRIQSAIQATLIHLDSKSYDLNEEMWQSIPVVVGCLAPFEEATRAFSDATCSLSMIPAVLLSIKSNIESLSDQVPWQARLKGKSERKRETDRQRERERDRESVCVCVCV
jgi:hypothetical protein